MGDRQRWVPGVLLSAGCLLTLGINRQRVMPLAAPLSTVPVRLADVDGRDGTISEGERRAAGMTSYLFRVFQPDSSTTFTVYVGYYDHQTQGQTIHSPKNCLPGAGWEALASAVAPIQTGAGLVSVNRYLLQNGNQRALVYYWYQGRGRVAANEYRVKWELLRDAALRGRSEEALVRIVVFLSSTTDEHRASEMAGRVAAELIPAVTGVLPA
jgi:EpsI family protein